MQNLHNEYHEIVSYNAANGIVELKYGIEYYHFG